jgi:hypothetical protein
MPTAATADARSPHARLAELKQRTQDKLDEERAKLKRVLAQERKLAQAERRKQELAMGKQCWALGLGTLNPETLTTVLQQAATLAGLLNQKDPTTHAKDI